MNKKQKNKEGGGGNPMEAMTVKRGIKGREGGLERDIVGRRAEETEKYNFVSSIIEVCMKKSWRQK